MNMMLLIRLNDLLFMWLICYSEWCTGFLEKRSCRLRGSCQGIKADPFILNAASFEKRNCYCDSGCIKYDDCCTDALVKYDNMTKDYFCRSFGANFGSYYVKKSCPTNYSDQTIKEMCFNLSSILSYVPVTNIYSKETYDNVFCAACNGELSQSVRFWNPLVKCETNRQLRVFDYNWVYNITTKSFTIKTDNSELSCKENILVPPLEAKNIQLRKCKPYISTCPLNWVDIYTIQKCKIITDYRYYQGNVYKNKYCALCNNVPIQAIACAQNASDQWLDFRFDSYDWTNGIETTCELPDKNADSNESYDGFNLNEPLKTEGRLLFSPNESKNKKMTECLLFGKCFDEDTQKCYFCPMVRMDSFPIAPERIDNGKSCTTSFLVRMDKKYQREGRKNSY